MYEEDLELQIINLLLELNHLFVLCQWDWIKAGIKYNSIYLISQEELMAQIIYKLYVYRFMQIVELEESTFQIDYIVNKNYLQSLNYSYQYKSNNDLYVYRI
jgi:hypothetical protein